MAWQTNHNVEDPSSLVTKAWGTAWLDLIGVFPEVTRDGSDSGKAEQVWLPAQ